MQSQLEYFLDNSNVFNMLEILKDQSKIYREDGCLPSKIVIHIRPFMTLQYWQQYFLF